MYEIEKDIPIPPKNIRTPWSVFRRTLNSMEVGESIFVVGKTANQIGTSSLKPKKFCTRKTEKDGTKGIRIWRIE